MKISTLPKIWKFIVGLSFYALAIVILTLFDDYRVSVFGFMVLCSITFALALWSAIPSKRVITALLVLSLLMPTAKAEAPPAKSDQKELFVQVVAGCAVLAVGAVIIWGMWKLCKKLLPSPPNPNNPPITNAPPDADSFSIRAANTNGPMLRMPDFSITEQNDWDTAVIQFQSTTNGQDWVPEYTATNWFNNSQFVSILYSNGLPLMTNFGSVHWTNDVMVSDFSAVMGTKDQAPLRLWRGMQLQ